MRARILCTAVAFCLLPVAASAQDGPPSASPPERPRTSTRSRPRVNLFLARPDTYAPRPDGLTIYHFPFALSGGYWYPGGPFIPAAPLYGNVPCAGEVRGCPVSSFSYDADRNDRHHAHRHEYAGPRSGPAGPPPTPAAPPIAPPPIAPPGPAKTFYVIAGCYAGDKPPQPEWLPPDCDLSRVRVIPP